MIAFFAVVFANRGLAQTTQTQSLLTSYYGIKDALINGDPTAALSAAEFFKTLGSMDTDSMSETVVNTFKATRDKLAFDAKRLLESKDLSSQRGNFAVLSVNFYKLAKVIRLTNVPIYYFYCPMKDSYWLSNAAEVKNPYFGKQMLSCGTVKETIQ